MKRILVKISKKYLNKRTKYKYQLKRNPVKMSKKCYVTREENRNDIGESLAGFSSHNYSPAGNTPSHQLNTKLSVAENTNTTVRINTNTLLNTNKNTHWDTNTIVKTKADNYRLKVDPDMILPSTQIGRDKMANGNHNMSWFIINRGEANINYDKC